MIKFSNLKKILLFLCLGFLLSGCNIKPENGNVKVIEKQYSASHRTTRTIASGYVIVPITTYHPETWTIVVEQDNSKFSFTVDEADFNKVRKNDILRYEDGKLYTR